MARSVAGIDRVRPSTMQAAMKGIGIRMIPTIRQMLAQNYAAAGIKTNTGTLHSASVDGVQIFVNGNRFELSMPRKIRYPNGSGNVYAATQALRYGAVRQPLTKATGDLYSEFGAKSQRMLQRKFAAGQYGENAKRTLKKSMSAGYAKKSVTDFGAGLHYIPPKKPFFSLTPAQRSQLMDLQTKLWNEQMALIRKEMGARINGQ
jgi:hypothetical protein